MPSSTTIMFNSPSRRRWGSASTWHRVQTGWWRKCLPWSCQRPRRTVKAAHAGQPMGAVGMQRSISCGQLRATLAKRWATELKTSSGSCDILLSLHYVDRRRGACPPPAAFLIRNTASRNSSQSIRSAPVFVAGLVDAQPALLFGGDRSSTGHQRASRSPSARLEFRSLSGSPRPARLAAMRRASRSATIPMPARPGNTLVLARHVRRGALHAAFLPGAGGGLAEGRRAPPWLRGAMAGGIGGGVQIHPAIWPICMALNLLVRFAPGQRLSAFCQVRLGAWHGRGLRRHVEEPGLLAHRRHGPDRLLPGGIDVDTVPEGGRDQSG